MRWGIEQYGESGGDLEETKAIKGAAVPRHQCTYGKCRIYRPVATSLLIPTERRPSTSCNDWPHSRMTPARWDTA